MDPCLRKMLTQTVYVSGSVSYKPGGGLADRQERMIGMNAHAAASPVRYGLS